MGPATREPRCISYNSCRNRLESPLQGESKNTRNASRRRDLKLGGKAAGDNRSFYDKVKFTPEQVRHDESLPWCEVSISHGGQWRVIRYKEVTGIYWQSGAKKRPLRLFVVAPVPYQAPGRKRKFYRDPVFLLTTDPTGTPQELLQAYFDRWQIACSAPHLAALLTFGPGRNEHYQALPKWPQRQLPLFPRSAHAVEERNAENPDLLTSLGVTIACKQLGLAAAA